MSSHAAPRGLRPLAPAVGASSVTPDGNQSLRQRSKKVSSACIQCKQLHARCTGPPPPCRNCAASNRTCRFDASLDARRKFYVDRRKIEEHGPEHKLLWRVFDAFRRAEDDDIGVLVKLVRERASIRDIRAWVDRTLAAEAPGTASQSQRPTKARRIEYVLQKQAISVSARPWTSVTDDNELASELITYYFTWCHPFFQIIDRDAFLSAMATGRLDSPLCSPFLVNALLALGCHNADDPAISAADDKPNAMGNRFYAEAKRLWDLELAKPSLVNLQGLCALMLESTMRGQDRVGTTLLLIINNMYNELGLWKEQPSPTESAGTETELDKARKTTAWSVFSLNMTISNAWLRPVPIKAPQVARPGAHGEFELAISWWPHPSSRASKPVPLHELLDAQCTLAEIHQNCLNILFDGVDMPESETARAAENSISRLRQWHFDLSDSLSLEGRVATGVTDLHLLYHAILAVIYMFFPLPAEDNVDREFYRENSHAQSILAAKNIASVCKYHSLEYSDDRLTITMVIAANIGLHCLLLDMKDEESSEAFVQLCRVIVVGSRRYALAKGVARMIAPTAAMKGVELPEQARRILGGQVVDYPPWQPNDAKGFSSSLPNYTLTADEHEDDGEIEMDRLLERWNDIDLASL